MDKTEAEIERLNADAEALEAELLEKVEDIQDKHRAARAALSEEFEAEIRSLACGFLHP